MPQVVWDDDLQKHVDTFYIEAAKRGREYKRISVTFGKTAHIGPTTAGFCAPETFYRDAYVIINYEYWLTFNDEKREQLILHELGHCVLRRIHDDSCVGEEVGPCNKRSLMHPYLGMTDWANNREYYIEELFIKRPGEML